ncbi:tetratricopeptide repeat protein [Fervidobacterium thailandense]|uniref:Tetratricopeptide repeat protein n=1 Tax=Fervidobacterium thailandense TaxID=1008305 RepID=A0A1E3G6Q9_9BACT|nr:hypothetical protein [Fervidobacterium thailandense]ODN31298.1 hypothetical protein A4H02_00535 [Fervidobacterium thailandense]
MGGRVKCVLIFVFLMLATIVGALTVEEILEKSKEDPEVAWDLYLVLLSSSDSPESLEELGRFLHAKRKLKNFRFAVEEDVDGLVSFLASNVVKPEMKMYILEIFGEEKLTAHLKENLAEEPQSVALLKVVPTVDEETLELVYESFIKNDKVRRYLLSELKKGDRNLEKLFGKLLAMLYNDYTSAKGAEKGRYMNMYVEIKQVSNGQLLYPQFESLIESERKLSLTTIILPILSTFERFSRFLPFALPPIVLAILLTIPTFRFWFYMALGMKKRAALVYKRIVEKDPLNEEKRLKLAQLYESAGMYEEALSEYNFLQRIKME